MAAAAAKWCWCRFESPDIIGGDLVPLVVVTRPICCCRCCCIADCGGTGLVVVAGDADDRPPLLFVAFSLVAVSLLFWLDDFWWTDGSDDSLLFSWHVVVVSVDLGELCFCCCCWPFYSLQNYLLFSNYYKQFERVIFYIWRSLNRFGES